MARADGAFDGGERRRLARARSATLGDDAVRPVGARHRAGERLVTDAAGGHEADQGVVPVQRTLALRVQVDVGRPTAGDRQQVARKLLRLPELVEVAELVEVSCGRDPDAVELVGPDRLDDHTAVAHVDLGGVLDTRLGAAVDQGHRCARGGEIRSDGVCRVVGREDDDPVPGEDAVAAEEVLRGRRQHHAGQVVVREDQRALERAGSQHDATRVDVPDPLPGDAVVAGAPTRFSRAIR